MVTTVGEAIELLRKLPRDKPLLNYDAAFGVYTPITGFEKVFVKPDAFRGFETDMQEVDRCDPEANQVIVITI